MHTIQINPKYETLRQWITSIPDRFETEGIEVYHLRNLIKTFEAPQGLTINVKRYHKPALPNRLIYSTGIRTPKGLRAYLYPKRLLACGIETPEPVAYIEERQHGLLGYSYFMSIHCSYPHTMYELGNAEAGTYEEIAVALAHYAANMHKQDILHKDFTPGNVLWKRDGELFHFSIVDINRMYFGPVSFERGLRNLIKFWGPKDFVRIIINTYAQDRGADPAEAEKKALTWRRQFWSHYLKHHQVPFNVEL